MKGFYVYKINDDLILSSCYLPGFFKFGTVTVKVTETGDIKKLPLWCAGRFYSKLRRNEHWHKRNAKVTVIMGGMINSILKRPDGEYEYLDFTPSANLKLGKVNGQNEDTATESVA